ncbi:hypothetical protein PRIPAC_95029 [Pristionchus pacificus]|uniref:Uncharacterized protein n=1 Tax=Pristionchus pacificus TaxID=54126 RepID=A0A2A6BAB3_PRIPA|nr:hypothetical protein PRIPAC_95029 [Pristionchus pacificus]|eukprot:PDM62818.1 hypothetical protein PRIPAC_50033 [Pristionchus pacificus]
MGKVETVSGETVTTTSSVIENIEARIASASDEEKQKLHSFLAKEGFNSSERPKTSSRWSLNQSRAGRLAIATLAAAVASFQQLTFEDVRMVNDRGRRGHEAYTFSSIFFDEVCLSLISHLTTEKAASTKAARSELTKQLKLAFNDASFVLLPPVGGEEEITNVISSENIP